MGIITQGSELPASVTGWRIDRFCRWRLSPRLQSQIAVILTRKFLRTGWTEESGETFTRAVIQDTARVRAIEKLLDKPIERQR